MRTSYVQRLVSVEKTNYSRPTPLSQVREPKKYIMKFIDRGGGAVVCVLIVVEI